jgi:hypothetical protein
MSNYGKKATSEVCGRAADFENRSTRRLQADSGLSEEMPTLLKTRKAEQSYHYDYPVTSIDNYTVRVSLRTFVNCFGL